MFIDSIPLLFVLDQILGSNNHTTTVLVSLVLPTMYLRQLK